MNTLFFFFIISLSLSHASTVNVVRNSNFNNPLLPWTRVGNSDRTTLLYPGVSINSHAPGNYANGVTQNVMIPVGALNATLIVTQSGPADCRVTLDGIVVGDTVGSATAVYVIDPSQFDGNSKALTLQNLNTLQGSITLQSVELNVEIVDPTTEAPTTPAPTTLAPTTQKPTTLAPTTVTPTTRAPPTTRKSTSRAPTTPVPTTRTRTTPARTTKRQTTKAPTTRTPTTVIPSTRASTTKPATTTRPSTTVPRTTRVPTTNVPTTATPSTRISTTKVPTTSAPTTLAPPSTNAPTTASETTAVVSTNAPTTIPATTTAPTTVEASTTSVPTTGAPSTSAPTTIVQTTVSASTSAPTAVPTTNTPTTEIPTTIAPTTVATTNAPTTMIVTTSVPVTTVEVTTIAPQTTSAPSTTAPTTAVPSTDAPATTVTVTTSAPTTITETTAQPSTSAPATTIAITTVPATTATPTTPAPTEDTTDTTTDGGHETKPHGTTPIPTLAPQTMPPTEPPTSGCGVGSYNSSGCHRAYTLTSFGTGSTGQLATGIYSSESPTVVPYLNGDSASRVQVSSSDVAVTTTSGALYMAGANSFGQLGVGTLNASSFLIQNPFFNGSLGNITSFGTGLYHTVVLLDSGKLYGFGSDRRGQLGGGLRSFVVVPTLIPTPFTNGEKLIGLGAGYDQTLVWTATRAWMFGHFNRSYAPLLVFTAPDNDFIVSGSSGAFSFFLVLASGDVYTMGGNLYGNLGLGTGYEPQKMVQVITLLGVDVIEVSNSLRHTLFLSMNNSVPGLYAVGYGFCGQLGLGSRNSTSFPMRVTFFDQLYAQTGEMIQGIAAGFSHSLVWTEQNLYVFGCNTNNNLGIPKNISFPPYYPVLLPTINPYYTNSTVLDADAKGSFSFVITQD